MVGRHRSVAIVAKVRIHETPVAYRPRTVAAGKKLTWVDGIDAIYALVRCRLVK